VPHRAGATPSRRYIRGLKAFGMGTSVNALVFSRTGSVEWPLRWDAILLSSDHLSRMVDRIPNSAHAAPSDVIPPLVRFR
jgi:hypothetical protein